MAPGYTTFPIHGELRKARCHTQRVSEWWGDYVARRYHAHTETRRNQIDASALPRKGEKAAGLSVKKNREDIMGTQLKREGRKRRDKERGRETSERTKRIETTGWMKKAKKIDGVSEKVTERRVDRF